MNTFRIAARASRWLVAAGVAFAALGPTTASAQVPERTLTLEPPITGGAVPADPGGRIEVERPIRPFFTKVGAQRGCDFVKYRIRFGLDVDPEVLGHPGFATLLANMQFTLRDQLPSGLSIETVDISGDLTGAGGGAIPAHAVSTTATANDTVAFGPFQLSPSDLDGFGGATERSMSMTITARIDPAAFPAPATVANQAFLDVVQPGGGVTTALSHNPALPDDDDIRTGEPTNITIDLTGCDRPPPPPPPPGDDPVEACFRVETGEVDCTPGGAAFIYHMDVGPEMGGNVVQLKTTTPGITIAPASQVVPAGGGTLSWTITGASPGDVVHLIVVGVETYSGPAEGVGICCTQTVDLVIPEDLDCPDGEPDIKVEKRANAARCTLGESCDFTITVSNAGDAPYSGKIVLEEVTLPVNTEVVSGPNAPWTCVPGATPMMCEHPETTLNPGDTVELKLGLKTPPEATRLRYLRNCAEYDYTASGKEPFGDLTNDKACAVVPICVPGRDRECTPQEEPRVDLTIRKVATPVDCSADAVCRFVITVINSGTTTYSGPLTVIDEFPTHPPASVNFVPSPPWSCVAESGIRFRCEHPPVTLVPGASIPLGVRAVATGYPTREVENCGEVEPVPGETNLTNNRSCAVARLPRPDNERPRLTVEKTGEAECRLGEECTFEITITNEGPGDFSGPMNIGDAMEIEGLGGASVPITAVNPPLGCAPEPTELPFMCEATVTLGAGESRTHEITVMMPGADSLPAGIPNDGLDGRNCFAIVEPGAVISRERTPLSRGMPEGDRENGRYSCHPFTVSTPEEEPQCSAGFVMNEAGRCVCPEGTTFRNGQCVGEDASVPTPTPRPTPPPERQCTLLPGQVRTQDGRCVCPRGTSLRNNRCVEISTPPPQRQCTLLPGQIRTRDGQCVCPRGTRLRNNRCVETSTPPPQRQCTLLPGQIRTRDGQCVCPRGTRLRNNRCVETSTPPPQRQCTLLPGQIRTRDGQCVCPRGTTLRGGRCVQTSAQPPQRPQACPPGTVGNPPNCRQVRQRDPQLRLPQLEFRLNVPGQRQQQQRN